MWLMQCKSFKCWKREAVIGRGRMLSGLYGKAGNQNVEVKQTQNHSGSFGENHCLIFGFAVTKTGWPGCESCLTGKSSVQDCLHNQFQLWLTSVLNKHLSSLGIFQFPVGWQRKDMQHRERTERRDLFNFCQSICYPKGGKVKPASFPLLTSVPGRTPLEYSFHGEKMFSASSTQPFRCRLYPSKISAEVLSSLETDQSCHLKTESTPNLVWVPA